MKSLIKHIVSYVTAGMITAVYMIGVSLFADFAPLTIGLQGLLLIWMPLYFLFAYKMLGVE